MALPSTPPKVFRLDWKQDLTPLIDKFVHIELLDGSIREGRISSVEHHKFKMNGHEYLVPRTVQLNGDSSDSIEIMRMKVVRAW